MNYVKYYSLYKVIKDSNNKVIDYKLVKQYDKKEEIKKEINASIKTIDNIIYKSFNPLLSLPYFIGQDHEGGFEPAIFGAEKGCPWIKSILSHYDNRHFLLSDGEFDTNPLPRIFYNILIPRYNMIRTIGNKAYDDVDKNFFVFPTDYFNSRDSMEVSPTYNSFCAHNYAGSWTKKDNSIKGLIINVLPKSFVKLYFMISHNLWNKSKYRLNINNNIK